MAAPAARPTNPLWGAEERAAGRVVRAVGSGKVEAAGADRAAVDVGSDTKAAYAAAAVLAALQEMAGFRAVKVAAVR